MSGNKLLLDTNVVLYVLMGDETIASFINGKELYLSIISELELLAFKNISQKESKAIESFIHELKVENISEEVKAAAIDIRKSTYLKLPDCIIAATSLVLNIPTSNRRQTTEHGERA